MPSGIGLARRVGIAFGGDHDPARHLAMDCADRVYVIGAEDDPGVRVFDAAGHELSLEKQGRSRAATFALVALCAWMLQRMAALFGRAVRKA
ncbi:MAG: hypothetical protein U0Y68_25715 [Blastocatellia bacterium]